MPIHTKKLHRAWSECDSSPKTRAAKHSERMKNHQTGWFSLADCEIRMLLVYLVG